MKYGGCTYRNLMGKRALVGEGGDFWDVGNNGTVRIIDLFIDGRFLNTENIKIIRAVLLFL